MVGLEVLQSVSYTGSNPTHEKLFAVGKLNCPKCHLKPGFSWFGLASGFREFIGVMILFICFPTKQNLVSRKHPIDSYVDIDIDADFDIDIDADLDIDIDADFDIDIDADNYNDIDINADNYVDVDADIDTDVDAGNDIEICADADTVFLNRHKRQATVRERSRCPGQDLKPKQETQMLQLY